MVRRVVVEIAVDSAEDAVAAVEAGADRVELCRRLDLDGLTPEGADVAFVKARCGTPVMAMLRLREGPFMCEAGDLARLEGHLSELRDAGADGVVFGFLTQDGMIDRETCRAVLSGCGRMERVFHRAIDRAADLTEGLECLIELGFGRVLTSGGATSAATQKGQAGLAKMVRQARGRIQVLAGGGVRSANAAGVVRETACTQVHSSARLAGRFDAAEVARLRGAVDVC